MHVMCYRTYKAGTSDSVTNGLSKPDDCSTAAAADDDDDSDDVYYQLPLPVEEIYWVDSVDSFHSSVSHIVQVYVLHVSAS